MKVNRIRFLGRHWNKDEFASNCVSRWIDSEDETVLFEHRVHDVYRLSRTTGDSAVVYVVAAKSLRSAMSKLSRMVANGERPTCATPKGHR